MNKSSFRRYYMEKIIEIFKNKVFIISTIIIFMLLAIIFNGFSKLQSRSIQAKNGILDLTNWDFEKDGAVSVDGEWEFYWNQLLTYKDFEEGKYVKLDGYFKVPSVWTN